MPRYLILGAVVAVAVIAVCCPLRTATGSALNAEWVIISTVDQYSQLMAMDQSLVVMFSVADCPTCEAVKQFWREQGIPQGWLFIEWRGRQCDTPTGKRLCGANGTAMTDELRAVGWKGQLAAPPLIVAKRDFSRRYFSGYAECTSPPTADWPEPTPAVKRRLTLAEWIKQR